MNHTRITLRACARRLAEAPFTLAVLLVTLAACSALVGCGGGSVDDDERKGDAPVACAVRPEVCR